MAYREAGATPDQAGISCSDLAESSACYGGVPKAFGFTRPISSCWLPLPACLLDECQLGSAQQIARSEPQRVRQFWRELLISCQIRHL